MRTTKCKSCNGRGIKPDLADQDLEYCLDCSGTGEISVYTIQELREGKVAIRDHTKEELIELFHYMNVEDMNLFGYLPYYYILHGKYCGTVRTDLPTQSVKIFLEEIEQKERQPTLDEYIKNNPMITEEQKREIFEPEFKWGEEVEFSSLGTDFDPGVYVGINPYDKKEHIVAFKVDNVDYFHDFKFVRKPQKITLTLSQIAEKFNCKPEQIKII